LFTAQGEDLKSMLRGGATDEDLRAEIIRIWTKRTDRYSEIRTDETADLPKVEMSFIGG
jgi:cyclic pyranopterin phosphate synthase